MGDSRPDPEARVGPTLGTPEGREDVRGAIDEPATADDRTPHSGTKNDFRQERMALDKLCGVRGTRAS